MNNLQAKVRKSTQADLDYAMTNPHHELVKSNLAVRVPETNTFTWYCEEQSEDGLHINQRVIGIGGCIIPWPGRGEFWMILTSQFEEKLVDQMKTLDIIVDKINELIEVNQFVRAQAIVRADFPKAIKMLEVLGFKNETPDGMEHFFPDGTMGYGYAKIRSQNGA